MAEISSYYGYGESNYGYDDYENYLPMDDDIYDERDLQIIKDWISSFNKAHIPNIHALKSDTHTLRIEYEYTKKQCVGVAIEGMDIWYMGLISMSYRLTDVEGYTFAFCSLIYSV